MTTPLLVRRGAVPKLARMVGVSPQRIQHILYGPPYEKHNHCGCGAWKKRKAKTCRACYLRRDGEKL